jgi:signal transduction histidine kinase
MTRIPARLRPRLASVRARIAIACAGLFLLLGAALIGATYVLADHAIPHPVSLIPRPVPGSHPRFGTRPTPGPSRGSEPGPLAECAVAPANVVASRCQVAALAKDNLDMFATYSLAGLGVGTVLAGLLGWAAGARVLRPLRAITQVARTASQESLHQRLALTGPPDELKELADTFDAMLTRLDAAFASQRRFTASASHELRTPLTEMRTLIDVALAKPAGSTRQLDPVLAGIRAAVDKSEELIEALLTLARSDRGLERTETVDLPTAIEDAIDLLGPAAAARHVRIRSALDPAQVTGDRVLLERLASNLIDNAVRHNTPGGWVLASTRSHAGLAELTVANSGEPIPQDQVTGLFEPFRRLPGAARRRPGTGLGLSIVASVARAHGGRAEARARPDGGLEVQVTLPATAPRHAGGATFSAAAGPVNRFAAGGARPP